MCVLPLTSPHFLLYILSIFSFFTPFCNRQMKVKKKNALNTYVASRTMRPSVTKNRRRHFPFSPFFFLLLLVFFFSIYLSICLSLFAFSFLNIHDSIQSSCRSNSRFFVRLLPILNCAVFCTLHSNYTIQPSVLFPSSFSNRFFFLLLVTKKLNTDWLTAFFSVGLFMCACVSLFRLLLPILRFSYSDCNMYVRMYEKKERTRKETWCGGDE